MPREEEGHQEVLGWYLCQRQGCHQGRVVWTITATLLYLVVETVVRGKYPELFFLFEWMTSSLQSVLDLLGLLCNWRWCSLCFCSAECWIRKTSNLCVAVLLMVYSTLFMFSPNHYNCLSSQQSIVSF
jgi:hypothetical protein